MKDQTFTLTTSHRCNLPRLKGRGNFKHLFRFGDLLTCDECGCIWKFESYYDVFACKEDIHWAKHSGGEVELYKVYVEGWK